MICRCSSYDFNKNAALIQDQHNTANQQRSIRYLATTAPQKAHTSTPMQCMLPEPAGENVIPHDRIKT